MINDIEPIVFVVDDDPSVRKSLSRLLRSAGYRTETFASPAEFLEQENHSRQGCLVLDVQMPGMNGLQLQEALAAGDYCLPIIFITGHGDIPMSVRAMKGGAVDFLEKPFQAEDLLRGVEQAIAKSMNERKSRAEQAEIRKRLATLTPREHEVLCHVVTGQLNKQIAADLGTVEKTVKVHRGRVMKKMNAKSLADLIWMAEKVGHTPLTKNPGSP